MVLVSKSYVTRDAQIGSDLFSARLFCFPHMDWAGPFRSRARDLQKVGQIGPVHPSNNPIVAYHGKERRVQMLGGE